MSDPPVMVPVPHRVRRKRRELSDTWTLAVEPMGEGAPDFAPGQFSMLYAFGVGEVPISISGDPRSGRLDYTIRAVGATTQALCALKAGDVLGVRGPFGSRWAVQPGRDHVVIAGGLGLAPLRPAVYELIRDRARFGRVALLVGSRSPDTLLFRKEVERWADAGVEVHEIVDRADTGWRGRVGVVTELLDLVSFDVASSVGLICGPEVMIRFAALGLEERGTPRSEIYVSLERNMHCAAGHCGHCQLGGTFVCKDGPVFPFDRVAGFMTLKEM